LIGKNKPRNIEKIKGQGHNTHQKPRATTHTKSPGPQHTPGRRKSGEKIKGHGRAGKKPRARPGPQHTPGRRKSGEKIKGQGPTHTSRAKPVKRKRGRRES
jgi:hypothetical protein